MASHRSIGAENSTHTGGPCNEFGTLESEIIPRPYDLMRQRNCKAEKVIQLERYPSIRPPISKCSYEQTKNWLLDSVDKGGCVDHNARLQDALKIWKLSPHKKTLGYYGVADGMYRPEAVKFNRTLASCLQHARGPKRRVRKPSLNSPQPKRPPQPTLLCQPYILNRQALKAELQKMPVVRQKLNPSEAFETLFCEKPLDPDDPLGVDAASTKMVSLREALDIAKTETKPSNHGLRRNHWYCPPKCIEPANNCTAYEWAKYKLDSRPYNEAFQKWFKEQQVPTEREPHNYDELYKRFQACFEVKPQPDPDCVTMAKCCAYKMKKVKEEDGGGPGGGGGGEAGGGAGEGAGGGGGAGGGEGGGGGQSGPGPGPGPAPGGPTQPSGGEKDKGIDKTTDKPKDNKDKGKNEDKDKPTNPDKDKDTGIDKENKKDKGTGKKPGKDNTKGTGQSTDKEDIENPDKERPKPKPPGQKPIPPKEQVIEGTTDTKWSIGSDSGSDKEPDKPDVNQPNEGPPTTDVEKPYKPPDKKPPKKKPPHKKPAKPSTVDEGKVDEVRDRCPPCPPVGCECCICDSLYAKKIPISPTMKSVFAQEKVREMREYLRRMRHREYMECTGPKPVAPRHTVDPIDCDNCFCLDPKISEYCECLGALQHLQRLLRKERHPIVNNELIFNLEDLRQKIAKRMCECF
ncbi:uncharacterized protein LOC128253576 [Drosophila gunungcola]|uniref:uncharacterized protein LOC128253576 n=1 Tax=Drosophila gunungcola TaxID=103775 RepID=UPI0022DF27E8|nr:uncharacterized protein LOC128253576 [Drosophila gunungcola]